MWSKDLPTTTGYFWFRRAKDFGSEFVVFIYKGNGGLMVEGPDSVITPLRDFESGEWQPVQPPAE